LGVRRTALIAGATGHTASRLVELLESREDWDVIGVSRRPSPAWRRVRHMAVDLLDPVAAAKALVRVGEVTHLFYCARAPHDESGVESVADNLAMLVHVVEAVESGSPGLERVHLIEGGKWYGVHLGPYRTPAREGDARHLPPNFYYDQEDWLRQRQAGKQWTWSASRPNIVCDVCPGRGRNLVSVLGAYATICRELGVPLDYPGSLASYTSLTEVTEAALLARAMLFLATEPQTANGVYNVTNGDLFRRSGLWPRLSGFFGMPLGEVRPMKLATWMADKESVWTRIVQRHGLQALRLDEVADWAFADFVFGQGYDVISDTTRLRQAGFHECVDSFEMVFRMLGTYRRARILP